MKTLFALALTALAAAGADAQTFPSRPVTMVVPYPAGGVTDGMARLIGEQMAKELGQPVVIDNVGGGAGVIGVTKVLRAAPDGYSVILGNLETNVTNSVSQQLTFDLLNDFDPVAMMPSYPFIIVSKNDVPAKTLPELVEWLRKNQEKTFQGTVGAGTLQHLCGLRMQERLGLKWSFVPYRGGAPAMQDMLAGQFDIMCTATGSFLPLIRAGQIRAYAVTAKARMEAAPEIPAIDEVSKELQGFHVGVWNALWTTKGSPPAAVARLNEATNRALADPALRKRIIDMGLDMPPADKLTPAALGAYQKSEAEVWLPIMRKAMGGEASK